MGRPAADEYGEYFHRYVSLVPDGDVLEYIGDQRDRVARLLGGLDPALGDHRYQPGKWSLKEVAGHIVDTERVFVCRALWFARNNKTPFPGFEQDDYVAAADFDSRTLADIVEEFALHRGSFLVLFRSFDEEVWMRRGTADGKEFTVRAIPYVIAGHADHHLRVIRERYL